MNETRERFLKAILECVPPERVVEIHFFTPIRQGPLETGVAVVAAEPGTADHATTEPATAEPAEPAIVRLEVHTARYRWVRKGPDRGKWMVDVVTEADAPFTAVDRVVRGVQERAGEAIEAQRLTANELRALMSEPAWQTSP